MLTWLVAFLLGFVIAALLTPRIRDLAPRLGAVDRGGAHRRVHQGTVPRLGGVAIVAAFYAPIAGLALWSNDISARLYADPLRAFGLFAGGLSITLLGVYDDLRGASATKKFAVQFAAAGLMYALGFRVENIANPFGDAAIPLGAFSLPFTLMWIVGVTNAMNLIDGLDGLASGVAFCAVATTFAIAFGRGDILMSLYMASLAGALLGFLVYNFNPASIFMGDSGSMFLGFILAVTSLQTSQKSATAVAMLVPVIALGLPIMDTLLAMTRRAFLGRPLFSADREHLHHRLLDMGLTHRQAVLVLYGVSLLFGGIALLMAYASHVQTAMLLVAAGVVVAVMINKLGALRAPEARRRTLLLRDAADAVVRSLGDGPVGEDDLWARVRPLADVVGAHAMTLLVWRGDQEMAWRWQADGPRPRAALTARFPAGRTAALDVTWADGRRAVDVDEEQVLEEVCESLAARLGES